jgi:CDP-glycerol glycerophosphotransferase
VPYLTPRTHGAIVFTSFHGRGYRGNPRAVFEHLRRAGGADAVWLSTEAEIVTRVRALFGKTSAELLHGAAGVRALARASAVVLSHGITDLPYMHLPRRAVVLQSWHGLPTKKGELLADDVSLRERISLWRKWAPVTHFLSSSPFVSELYGARFGLPQRRFVELGYPQYDALCTEAPARGTRALFPDAPAHERVVLYAPTFRKAAATRFFPFADLEPARLHALLEETRALVCLRPHPNDRLDLARALALSPRIVLADDKIAEDVVPLVRRADLIVTDYSSIYLEGLLADVPCLFLPYDRAEYERGLPWDYDAYTPGPKALTFAAFADALRRALGDRSADAAQRRRVRDAFFTHVDGRATERVAAWLSDIAAS